jgi:hypothetical protein
MTAATTHCDETTEHEPHPGFRVAANGQPGGLTLTPVTCSGLTAGACTPTNCVNRNDPVAQLGCKLC